MPRRHIAIAFLSTRLMPRADAAAPRGRAEYDELAGRHSRTIAARHL